MLFNSAQKCASGDGRIVTAKVEHARIKGVGSDGTEGAATNLLRRTVPAHAAGLALAKLTVAFGMLRLAKTGATFHSGTGIVDTGAVAKPAREALSWA